MSWTTPFDHWYVPHGCRDRLCCQSPRMESSQDREVPLARKERPMMIESITHVRADNLQWEIHLANYRVTWRNWPMSHRRQAHNNLLLDRKPRLNFETVLDRLYPKSNQKYHLSSVCHSLNPHTHTCIVTRRSSICTSLVRKSAPIVALYWLENLCETNWPIKLVLPTPLSPKRTKWYACVVHRLEQQVDAYPK